MKNNLTGLQLSVLKISALQVVFAQYLFGNQTCTVLNKWYLHNGYSEFWLLQHVIAICNLLCWLPTSKINEEADKRSQMMTI